VWPLSKFEREIAKTVPSSCLARVVVVRQAPPYQDPPDVSNREDLVFSSEAT